VNWAFGCPFAPFFFEILGECTPYFRVVMRCLIFISFILFSNNLICQTDEIDSLKKVVTSLEGEELSRVQSELSWQTLAFDTDEALRWSRLAKTSAERLGNSVLISDVLNDMSLVFLKKNEFDSTIFYAYKAYQLRLKTGNKGNAAASLSKVANAYLMMGRHDEALRVYLHALRLIEEVDDQMRYAQIAGNIGVAYEKNLNFDEAIKWHERAMNTALEMGDSMTFLNSKINIGICYNKLNQTDEVIRILSEALVIAESMVLYDQMSSILQSLGVAHRNAGHHEIGLNFYQKALEIYRLMDDKRSEALVMVNIGNAYVDLQNMSMADSCLNAGLSLAIQTRSLEVIRDAYSGMYLMEKSKGNYDQAIHFLERYVAYDDSIYNSESNEAIAELSIKYQAEKKQNQLLETQNALNKSMVEIERRNLYLISIASLLMILLVSIWGIILRNRIRRQKQEAEYTRSMEKERLRISRDLHDNLGAELTWITSELDIKSFEIRGESLKAEIQTISDKTREAMRSLRETIWAIHHENISLTETGYRLKEQTSAICKDKGIEFRIHANETSYLPDAGILLHVYRLCKEAVNNAIKHANCNLIELTYHVSPKTIDLTIADNGVGFQAENKHESYGLRNMHERMKELGGRIEIKSSSGEGTSIHIQIPIATAQS
jgi:signal transduction histidine kinase